MTGVIISKKVVIWYWTGSLVDLKFEMKKVTVQLKKLLFKEGINRSEENSYNPRVFSREFKSSIVIQSVLKVYLSVFKVCLSVILSVFECNLECETV